MEEGDECRAYPYEWYPTPYHSYSPHCRYYNEKYSGLEGMHCGVLTRTTPTLTPTTLRTFEQTIGYELQADPTPPHHNQAGFVPPPLNPTGQGGASTYITVDSKTWQGGCTTVIPRPSTASPPDMVNCITTTTTNQAPAPRRNAGGRRPNNNEKLSPEDEIRRNQRRERNKLAAARCRKRRMDHTNLLVGETEELDSVKQNLTMQLQRLQTEKEELEYLLQAHKPCKRVRNGRNYGEQVSNNNNNNGLQYIKQEHMDAEETPPTTRSRPTSLAVSSDMVGIPLNTPSSCIPNFESLIDGATTLTPVSNLVSMDNGTTPGGSLVTPTISVLPDSCSNQQRNYSSSSSDLSSPESVPPKLVSL